MERHEAPWSRAIVRDARGGPVAAGSCKLGAAYPSRRMGMAASGPDEARAITVTANEANVHRQPRAPTITPPRSGPTAMPTPEPAPHGDNPPGTNHA